MARTTACVRPAAEQAGARNLPLRIVVAADSVPAEGPDMAVGSADQLLDRAVERVRECVPDVTVSTQVIPGYARSVLREESRYASMLVVGRRGSGGFAPLRLGAVALDLSAQAGCPTACVPAVFHPGTSDVVVGVDRSAATQPASSDSR